MNKLNNKLILSIIALSLVLIVLIPLTVFQIGKLRDNATVATINGENIPVREFKTFLAAGSAEIYSYFKQKYNLNDSKDFWTSNNNGEIPIDKARKDTLEYLKNIKVQQGLAKKYGILKDTSYSSFLKELEEVNRSRKDAAAKSKVIYGPQAYGEAEYFSYVFSNMLIKLKEKLSEKDLAVGEEGVKNYYEANKDILFKREKSIKIKKLTLSLIDEKGNSTAAKKSEAAAQMEKIKAKLENGLEFEAAARTYSQGPLNVVLEEQTFDESTARVDSESFGHLKDEAQRLAPGNISNVVQEGDLFILCKVLDKKDMGYKPYADVRDYTKSLLIEKRYKELVEKLVKEAVVEINESNYSSIWVR